MEILFTILPIVLIVVAVVAIILTGYVKAPTDIAYVISGIKKEPRVLIGQAGIRIPILERLDKLYIRQVTIDIKSGGYVNTKDFIGVDIDATAKINLITYKDVTVDANGNWKPGVIVTEDTPRITDEMAKAALKNFLNLTKPEQIQKELQDSLQGNLREIISTQELRQLCTDRKGFGDEVQAKAQKDMNALGVYITSCNIQKISDKDNLINSLGQDNTAKIKKDAQIAEAEATAEVTKAKAKADEEANQVRVNAEMEMEQQNHNLEMRKHDLKIKEDEKRAEADAAYEIKKEEQRKIIEQKTADANIAKEEKEIELKEKQAVAEEKRLDAEIKKKADAQKYAKERQAEADLYEKEKQAEADLFAREKDAQASLFEEQKKAEALKAQADANAYEQLKKAEGIKAVGEAQAEAIRLQGIAEAEAIDKKAEAMQKYGQAALMEMVVGVLPEMAKAIAEPIASIDKLSIIDSGNGSGANSMYSMVAGGLAKTFETVEEATGLDIKEVIKANTYDAKVNRNINLTGIPSTEVADDVK